MNTRTYRKRKELGLCTNCGGVPQENKSTCYNCAKKHNDRKGHLNKYYVDNKKRILSQRKEEREQRKEAGTCTRCGREPAEIGKTKCTSCLIYFVARYQKYKEQCYDYYGRICVCCKESEANFLTLDHVNNDGAAHRKQLGSSSLIYRWAVENKFPSTLQTLCWNCQMGKQRCKGTCPHQRMDGDTGAGKR